jgi:hypothetical protein
MTDSIQTINYFENKIYEIYREGRVTRMTGNELHNLIKESIKGILGYDRR